VAFDKTGTLTERRAEVTGVAVVAGEDADTVVTLAAAEVGCANGSGSEAALSTCDAALLGNDLQGVPAAVGMARSTYAVIVQNFGWAMRYNAAARPLTERLEIACFAHGRRQTVEEGVRFRPDRELGHRHLERPGTAAFGYA
jgi:cation transport ATPase